MASKKKPSKTWDKSFHFCYDMKTLHLISCSKVISVWSGPLKWHSGTVYTNSEISKIDFENTFNAKFISFMNWEWVENGWYCMLKRTLNHAYLMTLYSGWYCVSKTYSQPIELLFCFLIVVKLCTPYIWIITTHILNIHVT